MLCLTLHDAQAITQLALEGDWQADTVEVHHDGEWIANNLGTTEDLFVVALWWD